MRTIWWKNDQHIGDSELNLDTLELMTFVTFSWNESPTKLLYILHICSSVANKGIHARRFES